jgi:hypothetical protein
MCCRKTRSARTKRIDTTWECSLAYEVRTSRRRDGTPPAKKGPRSGGAEALGIGLTRSSEGKYRALFCQSPTTLYIECYADSVCSPC